MRYNQIRAFHQVATYGGFSRAAARTHQSQPALSEHIRRLEQDYDVLLFHRDGRRVQLTDAGTALFHMTKRYFDIEQEIEEHLSHSRAALEGRLRIIADSATHVLPILTAFRRRHPKVIVQIEAGNSSQVIAALRNYDAEIGILGSLDPLPDIDMASLGTHPIVAISGPGTFSDLPDTIGFARLSQYPLVFREHGSQTRRRIETAARLDGVTLVPTFEVAGREAMREVVASGLGIGFISQAEAGHDPRIRLHRIAVPNTESGIAIAQELQMAESVINMTARRDLPLIRAFAAEVRRQGADAS